MNKAIITVGSCMDDLIKAGYAKLRGSLNGKAVYRHVTTKAPNFAQGLEQISCFAYVDEITGKVVNMAKRDVTNRNYGDIAYRETFTLFEKLGKDNKLIASHWTNTCPETKNFKNCFKVHTTNMDSNGKLINSFLSSDSTGKLQNGITQI